MQTPRWQKGTTCKYTTPVINTSHLASSARHAQDAYCLRRQLARLSEENFGIGLRVLIPFTSIWVHNLHIGNNLFEFNLLSFAGLGGGMATTRTTSELREVQPHRLSPFPAAQGLHRAEQRR
jgi:hypothetical protein